MKYWVYINDEVSQKPYSEAELQQIAGFGPNTLICSETSAVSSEPDWKPVRELLPHLVRPKAPNFSKFRPKPPVNQDSSDREISGQKAKAPITEIERDPELEVFPEIEEEETFISEPQNDQEDDVLEVPFDNDFEVPFDTNKSSEEIAREAEELLAKPISTEIEEYNTDDQRTELIDYASDMQKILEDTIRKTDFYQNESKKEKTHHTRTFIAEDLISKTTLDLSEDPKKEDSEKADKKSDDKDSKSASENKAEKEQTEKNEQETQEETSESETNSLDELLEGSAEKDEQQSVEDNSSAESEEESKNETEDSNAVSTAETPEQENEAKPSTIKEDNVSPKDEIHKSDEKSESSDIEQKDADLDASDSSEQKKSEPVEAEPVQSDLPSLDDIPSAKHEESKQSEAEPEEADRESSDDVSSAKHEESKQSEAEPEESDLASSDDLSSDKNEESKQSEAEQVQADLPSLDDIPSAKHEESKQPEAEPEEADLASLEESTKSKEKSKQQIEDEEIQNSSDKKISEKENKDADSDASDSEEEQKDLKETPSEKESVQDITDEQKDNEKAEESPDDKKPDQNSNADEMEISEPTNEEEAAERLANTSIMNGITISDDDTTAAVLDEIAREKEQKSNMESTASRLFEQLENTYKDEGEVTNKTSLEADVDLPDDLGDESSDEDKEDNEDEFLKTFTTSVEEVFLDQPTAIISDYVPPSEDKNIHTTAPGTESNIKREKPSDIKTVPLVPDALGQEIWSSPYVESATAKVRATSAIFNLFKWIFLILVLTIMGVLLLSGLAVMKIVPEKLSPIHAVIYSLQKTPQENNNSSTDPLDEDLEPAIIEGENGIVSESQDEVINPDVVINKVRNYSFNDGTTLEVRINEVNKNIINEIEWSADSTDEQDVYSVAVKIPQNKEGQGFSYRFNYNVVDNVLTPTTSEAKNIMENY